MKRREFVKAVPLTALLPAGLSVQIGSALAESPPAGEAPAGSAPAGAAPAPAASGGGSGTGEVPGFAKYIVTSDMDGTGPDGKPNGQTATFSGASGAMSERSRVSRRRCACSRSCRQVVETEKGQ